MLDDDFIKKMKERYSGIHPLIFQRSVQKASSEVELFDILDSFPHEYAVVWNESVRRWEKTKDLVQAAKFDLRNGE